MQNLGKRKPGSVVRIYFDTFGGTNGESVTMTGLAVGDIKIYKNGSVTERASTAGYTLLDTDGIDFDTLTGLHGISIDLADNTTAGFFTAGAHYAVAIDSITVDTQTVRFWLAEFDIGYDGAILDTTIATLSSQTNFTLTDGPAENSGLLDCVCIIHDVASAVQASQSFVVTYTGATKTVVLSAIHAPLFTAAAGDNISFYPKSAALFVAANAIRNTSFQVSAIDANAIASNAIDFSKIADSAITAAKIASNAITSAKIATDAIDASKLAASTIGASELAADAIDAIWDEVLSGATHNVVNSAGRRLRVLQEAGAYNGAIWIDTVNGTAGTIDFENGTDTNPVDNIADANTLAASLGISRFRIAPGSSITLAAAQNNQMFEGSSWTLALGGQSIDGSTFIGATVSGIGVNTAGAQYFMHCNLGAVTLPGDTHCIESAISGTQTLGEAGDFFFDRCHSGIAGTATPSLDFGAALNASNVNVRNYSGGLEIQNMGAGTGSYSMSLEGRGQLVINANCSATSTVSIRGLFTVTDNAGGAVTLSEDARADKLQTGKWVWDALRASHQVADSMAESFMTIVSGAAVGTPTTTVTDTDLTEATDDHYKDGVLVPITGAAAGERKLITGYNGTTKELTHNAFTTAMAATDRFIIL